MQQQSNYAPQDNLKAYIILHNATKLNLSHKLLYFHMSYCTHNPRRPCWVRIAGHLWGGNHPFEKSVMKSKSNSIWTVWWPLVESEHSYNFLMASVGEWPGKSEDSLGITAQQKINKQIPNLLSIGSEAPCLQCPQCEKNWCVKADLQEHFWSTHDLRGFDCSICEKKLYSRTNL